MNVYLSLVFLIEDIYMDSLEVCILNSTGKIFNDRKRDPWNLYLMISVAVLVVDWKKYCFICVKLIHFGFVSKNHNKIYISNTEVCK